MVVKPIVQYLLTRGYYVTVATRTKSKADAMIDGHANGTSMAWTVDDEVTLDRLVKEHDLTVSLLPFAYHVMVAKKCITHHKNMVTTSYVKPEMKALHEEAKAAGIIILNELGLDPGIDHMSAMRIIDHVHNKGGEVEEFYSFCGALPAKVKTPFGYRFSWSPKGVITASKNPAQYLKNGIEYEKAPGTIFNSPWTVKVQKLPLLEAYPNRDSLSYIDIYGLKNVKTLVRGTLRNIGWSATWKTLYQLGLLNEFVLKKPVKTTRELFDILTEGKFNKLSKSGIMYL